MFWVRKRNVSLGRFFYTPKHMFDGKKSNNHNFLGSYTFMSTPYYLDY